MDPTGRQPALCPASPEFRVAAFRWLPIDFCLADPGMLGLLCAHSRQMCCFHNSSTGRIAVRNVDLNTFCIVQGGESISLYVDSL